MRLSVLARRSAYRLAHRVLRVYWLIARPEHDGVKCVITDGDRVLLVQHTYGPREWDLPGGGMKRGEPAQIAAAREMHEELGLEVADWQPLGSIRGTTYNSRTTLHCFQVELRDPTLKVDAVELLTVRWFRRPALPPGLGRHVREILALAT
jgi:8-oxo-dGTP pyrophosphatase MutT (NUDIX family)